MSETSFECPCPSLFAPSLCVTTPSSPSPSHSLSKDPNASGTLTSAPPLPARMGPLALTSLVITTANVWLHLKVISTRGAERGGGCDGRKKAKLINFRKLSSHLPEPILPHRYVFIRRAREERGKRRPILSNFNRASLGQECNKKKQSLKDAFEEARYQGCTLNK